MNYIFVKEPGFEVLILQAPCFTNEPKLFWQHHTGGSLSRPPVSRMQLPAVFFVDQPKRKQQAKVSTDRLFSGSRQMNLHIWGQKNKKNLSVTNEIPPSCGIINHSQFSNSWMLPFILVLVSVCPSFKDPYRSCNLRTEAVHGNTPQFTYSLADFLKVG